MLTASVTEREHYEAQRLHATPRGITLFVVLFGAAVFLSWLHERVGVSGATLLSGCIGAVAGLLGLYFVFLPLKCARIYRQQRSLRAPFQFSWDESGISMRNELGEGRLAWGDFVKFEQNAKVILLYQSDVLFNVIPKSAFTSPEQLADFMEQVERIRR